MFGFGFKEWKFIMEVGEDEGEVGIFFNLKAEFIVSRCGDKQVFTLGFSFKDIS